MSFSWDFSGKRERMVAVITRGCDPGISFRFFVSLYRVAVIMRGSDPGISFMFLFHYIGWPYQHVVVTLAYRLGFCFIILVAVIMCGSDPGISFRFFVSLYWLALISSGSDLAYH